MWYVCTCSWVCAHVSLHVEARGRPEESVSLTFHPAFWDRDSHWAWNSLAGLDAPMLFPPSQWRKRRSVLLCLSYPYRVSELRPLCWHHQYFISWAVPQPQRNFCKDHILCSKKESAVNVEKSNINFSISIITLCENWAFYFHYFCIAVYFILPINS